MYAIGIDIGGMSAKIALVKGTQILRQERIETGMELPYEDFLEKLCRVIDGLRLGYPVEKIGISSCGLINRKQGTITYSNNIRWDNKSIVSDLRSHTDLPVEIANDAKCAALAEAVLGAGKDYDRVCMITMGTGVGGGFICHKRLDEGSAYADADGILGHITVENRGRACTCGRRGCLEAYASATAIMQTYREKTGERLQALEIFHRVRAGEQAAVQTLESFRYYLAEGLISLVNILRPEVIVLGGGVAGSADLYLPYLTQAVNAGAYGTCALPVKIVTAAFGNEAGMIGAALL